MHLPTLLFVPWNSPYRYDKRGGVVSQKGARYGVNWIPILYPCGIKRKSPKTLEFSRARMMILQNYLIAWGFESLFEYDYLPRDTPAISYNLRLQVHVARATGMPPPNPEYTTSSESCPNPTAWWEEMEAACWNSNMTNRWQKFTREPRIGTCESAKSWMMRLEKDFAASVKSCQSNGWQQTEPWASLPNSFQNRHIQYQGTFWKEESIRRNC
jgi:hypothetical protein